MLECSNFHRKRLEFQPKRTQLISKCSHTVYSPIYSSFKISLCLLMLTVDLFAFTFYIAIHDNFAVAPSSTYLIYHCLSRFSTHCTAPYPFLFALASNRGQFFPFSLHLIKRNKHPQMKIFNLQIDCTRKPWKLLFRSLLLFLIMVFVLCKRHSLSVCKVDIIKTIFTMERV